MFKGFLCEHLEANISEHFTIAEWFLQAVVRAERFIIPSVLNHGRPDAAYLKLTMVTVRRPIDVLYTRLG